MLNKNKIFLLLLLFAIIVVLMPSVAHAASDLFEIQDGDKSKEMFLDKLFNSEDLESSPLNNVILTFNTCVLMLGGVLAAYTLIAGTMSTAHDGEMLGKKWSAMWLPIRTTVGAAFIFPTMGGFCTAQIIVIWLIHQGIGLANTLWGSYVDVMPLKSMNSTVGPDKNEVFNLSLGILKSQYCSIILNKYFENQQSLSTINKNNANYFPQVSFFKDADMKDGTNVISGKTKTLNYYYGFNDTTLNENQKNMIPSFAKFTGSALDVCGKITFDYSKDSVGSSTGDFNLTSLQNFAEAAQSSDKFRNELSNGSQNVGEKSSFGANAALNQVNEAKVKAVDKMNTILKNAAQNFYKSEDKTKQRVALYDALNEATKVYISASKDSANKIFAENPKTWSDIATLMKKDGWMYAGTWYIQLYRIQTLMSNISKTMPTYSDPGSYWQLTRWGDSSKITSQMTVLESNIATFSDGFAGTDTRKILAKDYKENNMEEGEGMGVVDYVPQVYIAKKFMNGIKSLFTTGTIAALEAASSDENSDDPLGMAYNIGSGLENVIWGSVLILVVGATPMSAIVTVISTLISPLISLIFVISNMLTVILPFMPFFLWVGAILGWAMLCIEAVLASPLWIMIHIHPDGDGVVGRGGAGYGMVLSLTIRPALMILGLICALVCINIFAKIINDMFMTAFYTIASRDGISILQIPVIVGTYAMALFIVIKKSFSLIHVIPDEILKWLGVNNHNSVEKSSTGGLQTMMAAKMLDEKMGQMSLSNAINEGKKVTQDKDNRKNNLDQVDAGNQIGNESSDINDAASDPSSVEPSSSGKKSGLGDTVSDQNRNADAIISSMAGRPPSSMTNDEKKSLYEAHKAKAENTENLMSSGAVKEGTAGYEALDKVRQSSIEGMANSGYTPSTSRDGTDTGRANDGSGSQVGGENPGQNEGNGGGAGETKGNGGGAGGSESTGDNNEGGGGDNKPTKAK